MATENVNQSGAGVAADSAKEDAANSHQSIGPDSAIEESKPADPTTANAAEAEGETGGDFSAMLENYEKESAASKQEGEIIRGVVVGISEQHVLIDIGYKSEGVVPREEFLDRDGNLTVKRGDEVDVLLKSLENQEGYAVLSRADAVRVQAWDKLRQAHQAQETITGRVIKRIKGGLEVDIDGVEAFLPGSQVDVRPVRNLEAFINQEIEVRVIKINRKRGNVVVSRKALLEEEFNRKKGETLGNIEEGFVLEGTVKSLTEYGAFIDLGGIDGLLHIIDMSWGRIQSPNELFKVGDHLQVKVLKFDRDKERISLGYKQLMPDPWQSVAERFPIGSKVHGKVVSLTDYGAFIEIEAGVEGLVHVSEMTWSKRLKHPSKLLSLGQDVEALVLDVDSHNRRVSLGIKQATPDPWDTLMARYQVGSRVSGKVRSLTEFGAFIEIEDGIDGLVHVSDISWTKRIKHPSDVLKKGQLVDAVITNIDLENRRLSLSIKDLEPNAWDRFFDTHKLGDVINGKVVRFANFGAFVEIEEGIEGLCHVSELSDARVEKPEDSVQVGQVMPFKILKLDPAQKKIGLSARAVGKDNDPEDVRSYHDSGSGMATLGDIANLLGTKADKEEE
ncbi:MAG: 30S ribosomal protein S1 [Acidobacteria bacterium]|nr:30S ribosomal protein S1 [Acidobacteriota bacterium]